MASNRGKFMPALLFVLFLQVFEVMLNVVYSKKKHFAHCYFADNGVGQRTGIQIIFCPFFDNAQ